jgi:hypothetical protein
MSYNAMCSQLHYENRNIFFFFKKTLPGLPDFLETKYQNGEKYTKGPQNDTE